MRIWIQTTHCSSAKPKGLFIWTLLTDCLYVTDRHRFPFANSNTIAIRNCVSKVHRLLAFDCIKVKLPIPNFSNCPLFCICFFCCLFIYIVTFEQDGCKPGRSAFTSTVIQIGLHNQHATLRTIQLRNYRVLILSHAITFDGRKQIIMLFPKNNALVNCPHIQTPNRDRGGLFNQMTRRSPWIYGLGMCPTEWLISDDCTA